MAEFRTLSTFVARPWEDVYDALWQPETFPKWASGLSKAGLHKEGNSWRAEGPEGPVTIRFTERNPYGVLDHSVDTGKGPEVYVPLRVVANGNGAEVILTLFRLPGMSDQKLHEDEQTVKRDLQTLKKMLEKPAAA